MKKAITPILMGLALSSCTVMGVDQYGYERVYVEPDVVVRLGIQPSWYYDRESHRYYYYRPHHIYGRY